MRTDLRSYIPSYGKTKATSSKISFMNRDTNLLKNLLKKQTDIL